MKFPIRSDEYHDEPAVALVNRRAIQCGFTDIKDAWEFATRRLVGFDNRPDVYRIAYRSGVDARYLSLSTPTQAERQTLDEDTGRKPGRAPDLRTMPFLAKNYRQFMGGAFRVDQIDESRIRWCAECLAEKRYYRSIWSIKAYRYCATHRVELQSICLKCREEQRWPTQGAPRDIQKCRCGYHLDRPWPKASRVEPSEIDDWLYARFIDKTDRHWRKFGFASLITAGMPYYHAMECFTKLGTAAMFPKQLYGGGAEEINANTLALRGIECATKDGFLRLLDQVVTARPYEHERALNDGSLMSRLDANYGHLAKWLWSKRQVASFEAMTDTMLEHMGEPKPGPNGNSRRNQLFTATKAAEILGIDLRELSHRLLALGYIFSAKIPPSFLISIHFIGLLKKPEEAHCGYKSVARSLSVPEGLARAMLSVGCLSAEVTSASARRLIVTHREVERLLKVLEDSFLAGREATALVPLIKIKTSLSRAEIIMLVLEGRISVRGIRTGYRGLDRFMVAPDEVERAVHQHIGAVGQNEAMRLLRMNVLEIRVLVQHGQIVLIRVGKSQMLLRQDVNRCINEFVGERQALRRLNISRSSFRKMLFRSRSGNDRYLIFEDAVVVSTKRLEQIEDGLNKRYGKQLAMSI